MTVAANAVTFAYPTLAAPTTSVVVRGPNFNDRDTVDRRDVIEELPSGELATFRRGPRRFLVEWSWGLPAPLPDDEKQKLLNFWADVVDGPSEEFEVEAPNWGGALIELFAGATIAGSTITAGGGHLPGDLVRTDSVLYVGCSFEDSALSFDQERNGWFAGTVLFRAKGKTL